jgi:DNA-binding MarR family transcriptional regulator
MSNVYVSTDECRDLLKHLTPTEHELYVLLKGSILRNPTPKYFTNENLAKELGVAESTLKNAKAGLKKKGYAVVVHFKDERKQPMVRLVVGLEQVELYNLGVNVEITNAKAYDKLLQKFPVTNPTLSENQREEMIEELNQYFLEHGSEFK